MITLPPSKSIAARFMVATYFAGTLPGDLYFEDNEDLMVLQQALLEIYADEEPIDYGNTPVDVGASGTALRFVTAVCASSPGADYVVTGTPRLLQRPMGPMIDLLKEAGAEIETLGFGGNGPYRVKGANLKGGDFSIRGDLSSQFISAVMLVAPSWEKGVNLSFSTPLVSKPYIEMTSRLMQKFGIKVNLSDKEVAVAKGEYKEPEGFKVEADWSSAAFFYEACAVGAKNVEIADLPSPDVSLQGDAVACELFKKIGVDSSFGKESVSLTLNDNIPTKVEFDFKDCPDLLLPFAVACLCNDIHFRFYNVAHLRLKESDRLESLRSEAHKLGFSIKVEENTVEWDGEINSPKKDAQIDPHDDHRVAMAFAMAAFKFGEIRISNPGVVAKSFIDFWNQLPPIGLSCRQEGDVMTVSLMAPTPQSPEQA